MTLSNERLPDQSPAEKLRADFDQVFAQPRSTRDSEQEGFLAIGVAGHPYALRLTEISAILASKAITPLPGATPHLLGIAAFRGNLVPVYDLRALLGYPPPESDEAPRWLVLTAPANLALAFERFDGQLRAPSTAILPETGRPHIGAMFTGPDPRPILQLHSVRAMVKEMVSARSEKSEG